MKTIMWLVQAILVHANQETDCSKDMTLHQLQNETNQTRRDFNTFRNLINIVKHCSFIHVTERITIDEKLQ